MSEFPALLFRLISCPPPPPTNHQPGSPRPVEPLCSLSTPCLIRPPQIYILIKPLHPLHPRCSVRWILFLIGFIFTLFCFLLGANRIWSERASGDPYFWVDQSSLVHLNLPESSEPFQETLDLLKQTGFNVRDFLAVLARLSCSFCGSTAAPNV